MQDVASEKGVLAGIFQYGSNAYTDVADLITNTTFTNNSNELIFRCLEYTLKDKTDGSVDVASIFAAAGSLGISKFLEKEDEKRHLRAVMNFPIKLENVRTLAKRIRKLEIARNGCAVVETIKDELSQVKGDESIDSILGMMENPVYDFSLSLGEAKSNGPERMGDGLDKYIQHLTDNPVENVGISSGYPMYDLAIGGGFRKKTVNVIGARPKALAYGSFVYTPKGPVKIEDIKIGDVISHPFNGTSIVTNVIDFNKDIYRVYFRDMDYVDCCEDHLWEVYKRYPYKPLKDKTPEIKSTKQLMNDLTFGNTIKLRSKVIGEYKWDIRLPNPIEMCEQQVPLDPYILGLLIGDGSFRNAITYSTADLELIEYIKKALPEYDIKLEIEGAKYNNKCDTYRINSLQDKIRQTGLYKVLAHDKFIPDVYKYNSIENRIAIIQGLMDTDGSCSVDKKSGTSRSTYSTVSLRLANDIKEIISSLGGLCSVKEGFVKYKDGLNKYYALEVRLPGFKHFRLKRKLDRQNDRKIGDLKRTIVNIEKISVGNARCITVSNTDGLFLTDNCIITHNCGKTLLADNVAHHVASNLNIPVLNLDTEMSKADHWNRMVAFISGVPLTQLETGKFAKDEKQLEAVKNALDKLRTIPYDYQSIAGLPFEEIVSIMRRWIMKTVGLDENGEAKPCLIIYDYLKLMSSDAITKNLQEFQVLGFQMTGLHNFAVRYGVPFLTFIQLNRDGINKEDTDVASGSDRIIWLCSNFSIFKPKTDEEIAEDSDVTKEVYNRKLVPIIARHGAGMESGDYINMKMHGEIAKIEEGETRNEIHRVNHNKKKVKAAIEIMGEIDEF